jgi:hypothetical protein
MFRWILALFRFDHFPEVAPSFEESSSNESYMRDGAEGYSSFYTHGDN